ncbi:hypothetical protein BRLA_c025070 [Brevibacillus laterosporus LMG 15441]|uniref:Uncharacterized protein n=1 Tax=Brevibacillus laterosporus LMG 15441 TaxID=1042163 RepID=A0A075R2R5_BRELA|nr:hypothetical protein BRLA_c025070 [Brevibacillus laterosporus LMG 15441]
MISSKILDPLVTKFILPEHVEMLQQFHEDKELIEKPIIEEDGQSSFVIEYLTYVNMTMPLQLAGGKKQKRVEE